MSVEPKTPNAQQLHYGLNTALHRITELQASKAARPQTEAAARETEECLAAITEAMPIPMIITRFSDTLILAGNARLGELFGLPTQEMIGRLAREFFYSQKEFRRMMLEMLRQGSLRDREVRAKKADGSPIWIAASSEKMTFNGVPALVSSFYDLDERKKTEEALRQQAAELLARNAELDAFAHTVAHDLKSPLSIILGYTDLLIEAGTELDPQELTDYLAAIRQTTLKVNNIVDELLLLAEVRKSEIELQPLDMIKIVADSRKRLAYLIGQHEARIDAPSEWPAALGHAPWIEQVWVNYISNAIKYGGRPPKIELGATPLPDKRIKFWVRDNGRGLTPDQQKQLFLPFTQLAHARATGHGLGLSIVRRIVNKLDGEVGVESEVGQGSLFSFTLRGAPDTA